MNWKILIVFLLVFVVACKLEVEPVKPAIQNETQPAVQEPAVQIEEETVSKPVETNKTEPATVPVVEEETSSETSSESAEATVETYTELECKKLLSAEEFGNACGVNSEEIVMTYQEGTKNCFVNFRSKENERRTAGATLVVYDSDADAMKEFERRLDMRNVKDEIGVGVRSYKYSAVDRLNWEFVRGKYFVSIGSDTNLCPQDKLLDLAKALDAKLV